MSLAPPFRLAVVLSHPTQYYSPWFRWLRASAPIELRVFYLWDFGVKPRRDPQFQATFQWDVDLLSAYESEFVPNVARDPGTHHFLGLNNPELSGRLAAWQPQALLLFGYKWLSHLRAFAWAHRRRLPLVFRGDSHFLGRRGPRWPSALPLRWLYRRFAAVTYVGAANRAYFERLGVPPERLFFAPHSVDSERFDSSHPGHRAVAARLRAQLGLPPDTAVVLYAGKFVQAKAPRGLLEAFLKLAPRNTALIFVGEGPEKPALEALVSRAQSVSVFFLPFANQAEMPGIYLLANLFVLPSRGLYETWGLAVNEAMHMGAPCLVSDRVGCQQDLVTPGETGWVFRAGDPFDLQEKLGSALAELAEPGAADRIRRRVAARVSGYTYVQTTAGLLAALDSLPGVLQ